MPSVTVQVPDDVLSKLANAGRTPEGELGLAAAFSLCQQGRLSTSQAARLAGLTYAAFLEAAARERVELFAVTAEEVAEELDRGFTLGRQRVADHPAG